MHRPQSLESHRSLQKHAASLAFAHALLGSFIYQKVKLKSAALTTADG